MYAQKHTLPLVGCTCVSGGGVKGEGRERWMYRTKLPIIAVESKYTGIQNTLMPQNNVTMFRFIRTIIRHIYYKILK